MPKTQTNSLSEVGIVHDTKQNSLAQQRRSGVPKRKESRPGDVPSKRLRKTRSCLECLACGFIFKDRARLDVHVQKHIDEKMLVCDLSNVRVAF